MAKTKKVAVLVSGGGTNLQALINARDIGILEHAELSLVISSKAGVKALERAERAGIENLAISVKDFADRAAFDNALLSALQTREIEIVVLAGFMYVLGKDFIAAYRNKIINIHPALIPSFCGDGYYGLRVHEAALSKGVKVTGATVHLVNEITDGGPILLQKAIDVHPNDTPETLQRRVMEECEWPLLPKALEALCSEQT